MASTPIELNVSDVLAEFGFLIPYGVTAVRVSEGKLEIDSRLPVDHVNYDLQVSDVLELHQEGVIRRAPKS